MPGGEKIPIPEFAAKIKAKYPEYKDVNDTLLTQKITEKYPEYKDMVDYQPAPVEPNVSDNFPKESVADKLLGKVNNQPAAGDTYAVNDTEKRDKALAVRNEAIDNTIAKKNKGFTVSKTGLKAQKDALTQLHDNGDLAVAKDKDGKPVLKKSTGFLASAIDAINQGAIDKADNENLLNLDTQGKIDYLKAKALDENNSVPSGAAGAAGNFIGENADILAKGTVGALTGGTLAPEIIGASNFGSFVSMVNDFAKGGAGNLVQKTFADLKQQNPQMSDYEAMQKAEQTAPLGAATGIATGALLSGMPKVPLLQASTPAAQGFLKGIAKSASKLMSYEAPKMAVVSGAEALANSLGEMGAGVNKTPGEVLSDVGESAAHGAVIGAAFYAMQHPLKVLSYLRPQAENVVASIPKEQRTKLLETAQTNGVLSKEEAASIDSKAEEFAKAKKPFDGLPIAEENKAALAGKALQKQKLTDEKNNLAKHGEAFLPRIAELDGQIADIEKQMATMYNAKDVFAKEKDSVTGEKLNDVNQEQAATDLKEANDLGFEHPVEAINSVNKHTDSDYSSFQDIPKDVLQQVSEQRKINQDAVPIGLTEAVLPRQQEETGSTGGEGGGVGPSQQGDELAGESAPVKENGSQNGRTKEEIIKEIKSLPLTHVSGLGMGAHQADGMYISTEKTGNRYDTGSKAKKVTVDISNPKEMSYDDVIELRNDLLNKNKSKFKATDFEELKKPEGRPMYMDDLNNGGTAKLSKIVTKHLQEQGHDSIYMPEHDTQEGQLIVFDRNKVDTGEPKPVKPEGVMAKARGIEDLTDPHDVVLKYFIDGGKINSSAIRDMFAGKSEAIRINSSIDGELKSRIGIRGKEAPGMDELAHYLWESNRGRGLEDIEKFTTRDYRDALERVLLDYTHPANMAKDLVERYINKSVKQELSEAEQNVVNDQLINSLYNEVKGLDEDVQRELVDVLRDYQNEYGFVDWEKLEEDTNGFDPKILSLSDKAQNSLYEAVEKNNQSGQSEPNNPVSENGSKEKVGETIEQRNVKEQLTKATDELSAARSSFDAKRKELDKGLAKDQEDLFGDRKSKDASLLFDERASQAARDKAIEPFKARVDNANAEVQRLQKKLSDLEGKPSSHLEIDFEAAKTEKHYEEIAGAKPNTKTGRVVVEPIIGGSPKSISQIIKDVSNSLSQKLFFSKPGRRKAIGTYNSSNTAIKIRYNGDLDTTAHELGHSLDDTFGILADLKTTPNKTIEAELNKFSGHGSEPPKGHPDPKMYKLGEGFAEWLRAKVVNPTEAIKLAPELNKIYETKVSDKFKKAIEDFSTDVRTWAGATGRDITLSNIEWKPEEAQGLMKKIFAKRDNADMFHISFADKLAALFTNPMKAFEKAWEYARGIQGIDEVLPEDDPTILSRLFLSVDRKTGEFLETGLRDSKDVLLKDKNGNAKNLKWLLEPLDNADQASIERDMKDTIAYMVAERTVELSKKFNREDVLSGVGGGVFKDIDVAQKTLDEFNNGDTQTLSRIKQAAERYRSFSNDLLQYLADKGRMEQKVEDKDGNLIGGVDFIKKNNLQYVAMRRIIETEPEREIEIFKGKGGRLSSVSDVVKKITGSTKAIVNPYISLLDTMFKSIKEADRNDVMRAFRDVLVQDRQMYEGEVLKLAEVGIKGATGDKNTITIFVDGKPEKWMFQEDVYRALKGLDSDGYKLPKILTLHAKVLRATVTKFPVFALRNVMRDTPDRLIKSVSGSGFKDFVGDKEHWRDVARNGGLNAGMYVKDKSHYYGLLHEAIAELSKSKKNIIANGDVLKKAWRGYESILEKSETANRVAEYRAGLREAKKKGMDDYNASLYAAFKSRDLMDFALMGHWMREINKVVPFSNAAVQGLRSTYNSIADNPIKFTSRVIAYTVIPQVALWALNHKDEETAKQYEEMPDYQRDMFFNFKIGTNKWMAMPKPYELGLIAAAVDRSLSKAFGHNDKAFDGLAGETFKTLSPIDQSALTNSFTPELEMMFNYNLFTNKHIIPENEQPLDLTLRNTEYASRLGQAVQKVAGMASIGIDARKVDYWIKAHFSYVGDVAIKASDAGSDNKQGFDATTTGLIKRTPAYNSKSVQDMLDFVAKWDLGKSRQSKQVKAMAHEYFNTKSDDDKERISKEMIDLAKKSLATWEPLVENGKLKSQVKAQSRKH